MDQMKEQIIAFERWLLEHPYKQRRDKALLAATAQAMFDSLASGKTMRAAKRAARKAIREAYIDFFIDEHFGGPYLRFIGDPTGQETLPQASDAPV